MKTRLSIESRDWRHDTPNAIGCIYMLILNCIYICIHTSMYIDHACFMYIGHDIHPPSPSNRTLFCLGVQFVPKDLLHILNSRKIFNVRMQVIFGEKSLSSLFRILRQEFTTVFPAMWYCFTTAKGAENWSRAVHVRPRGFERCTSIFGASFAGLFWALQASFAASQVTGRKDTQVPHEFTQL